MKTPEILQDFYRWVKTWVKSESVGENVGEIFGILRTYLYLCIQFEK